MTTSFHQEGGWSDQIISLPLPLFIGVHVASVSGHVYVCLFSHQKGSPIKNLLYSTYTSGNYENVCVYVNSVPNITLTNAITLTVTEYMFHR